MARILTKLQFRELLTIQEKVNIAERAKTDPIIQVFLDDVALAQEIDLDYAAVTDGLKYAVSVGLLTSERADEILSSPVPETPATYSVTIKALDIITPQNISGATQRVDGKWIVKADILNETTHINYNVEFVFDVLPTQENINARINTYIQGLR